MANTIFRSSSLYAIGTIARTASSIIMLPIYTRYLTPEIYGTAELLNLILDLTLLLLGVRITAGMFKFHSDEKTLNEKNIVLSTCLWLSLIISAIAIVTLWFSAPAISIALNNSNITDALRWFAFTIAFGSLGEVSMGYFRVNDQAGRYLILSLIKLTTQIAASIYFIVYLELGLWGIIYASLTSVSIQALILASIILPKIGLKFSKPMAKKLIRYSLPIIYASIAIYYMTFGDRYFLQIFHDATEVGLYALGYKFGFMLIALAWTPFMNYWGAKQFDHAKEPEGSALFSKVFDSANFVFWLAASGMIIFAEPVINVMADIEFHSAARIVPFIALAYVFQGWTEFHKFGILNSANTIFLTKYNWLTAVVITVLYLTMIPAYGGLGAGLATAIAMLFRFILVYKKSQSYFSFDTNWVSVTGLLLLSTFGYLLTLSLYEKAPYDFITGSIIYLALILAAFATKTAPIKLNEILNLLSQPGIRNNSGNG